MRAGSTNIEPNISELLIMKTIRIIHTENLNTSSPIATGQHQPRNTIALVVLLRIRRSALRHQRQDSAHHRKSKSVLTAKTA